MCTWDGLHGDKHPWKLLHIPEKHTPKRKRKIKVEGGSKIRDDNKFIIQMQMRSDRWNGKKPLAMDARTLWFCGYCEEKQPQAFFFACFRTTS